MNTDPHPLHPGQIESPPEAFQVDELSRRVHERDGTRVHGRALPTAATTRGHPRWRWGRRVDTPSSPSTPLIMSPSDLERPRDQSAKYGTLDELRARLKR